MSGVFYVLHLEGCPEVDEKFDASKFPELRKTENSQRTVEIFPHYSEDGPAVRDCRCNGRMYVGEKEVDIEIESVMTGGCNLRVKQNQATEEEVKEIAKYFGVEEDRIEESDV